MVREAERIDIESEADFRRLVQEVKETRQPKAIQENGETVAMLVPAGSARRQISNSHQLVDTRRVPRVYYRDLDDLIQHLPDPPARALSDEELGDAIEEARIDAWNAKNQ